jgi:hypothetical protein
MPCLSVKVIRASYFQHGHAEKLVRQTFQVCKACLHYWQHERFFAVVIPATRSSYCLTSPTYYLSLEISEDSFDTTNFNGSWSVSSQHEVACCNEQPISDANIRLTAFAASTIHKYFL